MDAGPQIFQARFNSSWKHPRGAAVPDQLIRWCCIDRLSWQHLQDKSPVRRTWQMADYLTYQNLSEGFRDAVKLGRLFARP